MHKWIASAAGGTSHRLKPGPATDLSRSRKDRMPMRCVLSMHPALSSISRAARVNKAKMAHQLPEPLAPYIHGQLPKINMRRWAWKPGKPADIPHDFSQNVM